MRQILLGAALLASACGGSRGVPPAEPVASSTQAVTAFMQAARDSNLTRMAELWGTSRGPASQTRPSGYEKRLAVMQVYLHGDSTRILSDDPVPGDENRRRVQLALYRGSCIKQIPATTVRVQKGWIVQGVDLSFAGNPARPCEQ
ncbi:MAG TPA: hypothetical protein VGP61_07730 [Gemmatimonadales bacterium]|jgi:hypothetical protein|nr:hypothetical protein [Gemmatimonadales bacterium]